MFYGVMFSVLFLILQKAFLRRHTSLWWQVVSQHSVSSILFINLGRVDDDARESIARLQLRTFPRDCITFESENTALVILLWLPPFSIIVFAWVSPFPTFCGWDFQERTQIWHEGLASDKRTLFKFMRSCLINPTRRWNLITRPSRLFYNKCGRVQAATTGACKMPKNTRAWWK